MQSDQYKNNKMKDQRIVIYLRRQNLENAKSTSVRTREQEEMKRTCRYNKKNMKTVEIPLF